MALSAETVQDNDDIVVGTHVLCNRGSIFMFQLTMSYHGSIYMKHLCFPGVYVFFVFFSRVFSFLKKLKNIMVG